MSVVENLKFLLISGNAMVDASRVTETLTHIVVVKRVFALYVCFEFRNRTRCVFDANPAILLEPEWNMQKSNRPNVLQ